MTHHAQAVDFPPEFTGMKQNRFAIVFGRVSVPEAGASSCDPYMLLMRFCLTYSENPLPIRAPLTHGQAECDIALNQAEASSLLRSID